ncbi:Topoisomerase associated factor [Salix suchowensis]|nr:Topoisomerase associated factor [Salix suchowensis]
MADPEVIEIFDDEDADDDTQYDRRALFEPVVRRVVDALGGREDGRYRLGDEVTSCLKDLKKLWRKDDTDDERSSTSDARNPLPPLAKPPKERKERDGQIVSVVLHLIRNLAFIKDLPSNSHLSSDQAEFSTLQTKLVLTLQDTNILALLVTIAANSTNDPMFTDLNALVLEIFYLLLRGVKPSALSLDQAKASYRPLGHPISIELLNSNRRKISIVY